MENISNVLDKAVSKAIDGDDMFDDDSNDLNPLDDIVQDTSTYVDHGKQYFTLSAICKAVEKRQPLSTEQKLLLEEIAKTEQYSQDTKAMLKESRTMHDVLQFVRFMLVLKNEPDSLVEGDVRVFNALDERLKIKYIRPLESETYELRNFIGRILESEETRDISLNWIDVAEIEDMTKLFYRTDFRGDISRWDVSNVRKMKCMFEDCEYFDCNLNNWNVSNVEDMSLMFTGCTSFNQSLDKWSDKLSKLKYTPFMFEGCEDFEQDISEWKLPSIEVCDFMFKGCEIEDENIPMDELEDKYSYLRMID